MDRDGVLLAGIIKEMVGLEIGASYSPIAPKADGWNVRVVDHAPREVLEGKYRDEPNVDVARIEHVDVVWNDAALHECFAPEHHHAFDYCLASHVIEHIPDLITFLRSFETLLAAGGVLSLAVPDKRYCFDVCKPFSTTAAVLAAHTDAPKMTRHSPRPSTNTLPTTPSPKTVLVGGARASSTTCASSRLSPTLRTCSGRSPLRPTKTVTRGTSRRRAFGW